MMEFLTNLNVDTNKFQRGSNVAASRAADSWKMSQFL